MRKKFEQQLKVDSIPIEKVTLPLKSRDELPPVLRALQYIYSTPSLNEEVFSILEMHVLKDKKATGRLGMSLWEILVLATVRLCLDTDYDRLHMMSNYDKLLRMILGVETNRCKSRP
jgi:IS5 family transposase